MIVPARSAVCVDRAGARDLIFQTVDPVGPNAGDNASNVKRIRYCLDTGGKLYVAGGTDSDDHIFATLQVYNAATNSWSLKASMPTARYNAAGGQLSGLFLVVGGETQPYTTVLTRKVELPGIGTAGGFGHVRTNPARR